MSSLLFVLLSLALVAGYGCSGNQDEQKADENKIDAKDAKPAVVEERYKIAIDPRSPAKGPEDALVTVVLFDEFQCPFCKKVSETIDQFMTAYDGKIRLVFRHNPLPFHKNAELAAQASMAAHEQGKFWEMYKVLFANQQALERENLEKYATDLGLDMDKFKKFLDEGTAKKLIEDDKAVAVQFGARGTPHFFINGIRLRGAQPLEKFKEVIDVELKKAEELRANGVKDVYAEVTKNGLLKDKAPEAKQPQEDTNVYKVAIDPNAPLKGDKDAVVTILLFTDFQCPFCSRVNPTLDKVIQDYPGKVRLYFGNLPLPFHKSAGPAANAALYAHEKGKFWEMHDKLFAGQKDLSIEAMMGFAKELGLNADEMKAAVESEKYKEVIAKGMAEANKFGARGTPSMFINGRKFVGAQPYENFKKLIDELLPVAEKVASDTGKKGDELYAELTKNGKDKAEMPPARPQEPAEDPNKVYDVPAGNSYFEGPKDAAITIVEFSEFQCPFCSRVLPAKKQIMDAYKGKVKFVFKHTPLPFHKDAQLASEAALAAGEQGKFWEMHDKLFANQKDLSRPSLEKFAGELGLNMDKFKKALDSGVYKPVVEEDKALGMKVGARGTPTLFINGRKIVGAQPFENFKKMIDEELAKKK